jgi:hypothetical protein
LKTLLQEDVYAVAIEGKEGIGKTTVLSQFVRKTPAAAISIFVSAANRLSYDADLIRMDIAVQVYWALNNDVLDRSRYDPALLKIYYADLQRQAKQRKATVYFIVDGVEELDTQERNSLLQQLADILPLGIPQFRFLFSGDESLYKSLLGSQLILKSYPLTEFGIEETRTLFSSHHLTLEVASDIRGICRGMPSRLAGVLRAIDRGSSAEEFVRDAPNKYPEFFEIDWRQVEPADDELKRILALLAFDRKPHKTEDIATILDMTEEDVRRRIATVNFLSVDNAGDIRFANEGLRRYIADRLKDKKAHIQKRLIKRLLAAPKGSDSAIELPEYLEDASQFQDLLDLLTPDHILQVLERSQTLSLVDDTVRRGFRSAEKLSRDPDILRFGIQKSIIAELAVANVWESEVTALATLGRDTEALALANNAVLREDRLQMLAALAHAVWVRGDTVPTELLEQIRLLIENLDYWTLGRRARSIASKLVCVSPDLATTLLKKAKWTTDDNDLDRAFAHLTIKAIRDLKDDRRRAETLESVTRSRQDPAVRGLLEGVRVLSGRLTAPEVCTRSDEIHLVDAKISVLRYWCLLNGSSPEADLVACQALKVALAATSVRVDASLLADLSRALDGAPNPNRRKELISALDGVRATARRLGPSVDYVRLQLNLATAEREIDPAAAEARIVETADYVSQIPDLPSKGEAYAHFLGVLNMFFGHLASADKLRSQCSVELETVVLILASSTADHQLAMGSIIAALAVGDLEKALDYTRTVNTEGRRDAVLLDIVQALLRQPIDRITPTKLNRTVEAIVGFEDRDDALLMVLKHFEDEVDITGQQVEELLPIISALPKMRDSVMACRALVSALTILDRVTPATAVALPEHLWGVLHTRWSNIDVGWVRIDTGFGIATDLAVFDQERANEILTESEALKSEWRIAARRPASAYTACIQLASRAFCGLLPRRLESDADTAAIAALIEILPSYGERSMLWADLCMRAALLDRLDLANGLVSKYLAPAFANLSAEDASYRTRVLVYIAPALYKSQPASCLEQLYQLDSDSRDIALRRIIGFLLSGDIPSDGTGESRLEATKTNYETLLQVEALAGRLETDWMIYLAAKDVADVMTSSVNRYALNTPQREDIARRFHTLANEKLPITRQICHPGYRIVTVAQSMRMRQAKPNEWSQTIAEATALENIADRVYVIQVVALALPKSMKADSEKLLEQARRLVSSIPWEFDQIERYIGLAEDVQRIDSSLCRELLMQASSVIPNKSVDVREQRRRLVDIAYRVDKELAEQLIDRFDDDEAKHRAQAQVHYLEVRKSIAENAVFSNQSKTLQEIRASEISKLGWSLLCAVKEGRVQSYHPSELRKYLELAAGQPLNRAYSVLCWYIENAVVRYSKTDQAPTFLRPMFDACVVGAELAGQIAGKALIRLKALKSHSTALSGTRSLLITPGTREEAIRILSAWFERYLGEKVNLHDPYFTPNDLSWLQVIRSAKPSCRICVLTSRVQQPALKSGQDLEEMYLNAWRGGFDQSPPNAEIAIIGGEKGGESPIHDRWLVSSGAGLRFGTSLNSLGLTKDSEISEMSQEAAEQKAVQMEAYLTREKTEHNGEKLRLTRFWLS